MNWRDKRVSLSKDIVEGMKSLKYLGWEGIFKLRIDKLRSSEFVFVSIIRFLDGILSVFWNCVNYFLLYAFLVEFIDEGNDIKG